MNTLGAGAGAGAGISGWVLVGTLGFLGTVRLAGVMNMVAAISVLALWKRGSVAVRPPVGTALDPSGDGATAAAGRIWPWYLIYGLTGAVALGLEVVFFRVVDALHAGQRLHLRPCPDALPAPVRRRGGEAARTTGPSLSPRATRSALRTPDRTEDISGRRRSDHAPRGRDFWWPPTGDFQVMAIDIRAGPLSLVAASHDDAEAGRPPSPVRNGNNPSGPPLNGGPLLFLTTGAWRNGPLSRYGEVASCAPWPSRVPCSCGRRRAQPCRPGTCRRRRRRGQPRLGCPC